MFFGRIRRFLSLAYTPRYLLYTNMFTSTTLLATADVLQQSINTEKHPTIDWQQAGRMGSIGIVYGPMSHYWYKFLESRMWRGTHLAIVGKKIFWDTLATPLFSAVVILGLGLLEGLTPVAAIKEYFRKLWYILALDLSLWPPAQFFNFFFLPPYLRVLYCNFVTLAYNCGLSYIKHCHTLGIE